MKGGREGGREGTEMREKERGRVEWRKGGVERKGERQGGRGKEEGGREMFSSMKNLNGYF